MKEQENQIKPESRTVINLKLVALVLLLLIALSFLGLLIAYLVRGKDVRVPRTETYRAAVVEYEAVRLESAHEEVNKVLPDYLKMITEAKRNGADIIVFPELTLNRGLPILVPDEEEKVQPWNEPHKYSEILYELSKAAYNEEIYVVAHVVEKALSEKAETEEDRYIVFSTNVVLDTTGRVISRYRKIHLFGEPGRTPSLDNKLGIFETNFGVKFGHFAGFDFIFQQPAIQMLKKESVNNVIFMAEWYSSLPFFTAIQLQESWALVHNVNLLASGASRPSIGSTGSGIYSGKRGRQSAVIRGIGKTEILYADLPKNPKKSNGASIKDPEKESNENDGSNVTPQLMDNLYLMKSNLTYYNSVILDKSGKYTVRHGGVTCSVDITLLPEVNTEKSKYVYRLVTYDGIRLFTVKTAGISDCGVVACLNKDVTSCATRFKNNDQVRNTISSIELRSIVPMATWNEAMTADSRVYYPVTVDTSIMPLPVDDYDYTVTPNKKGYQEIAIRVTQVEKYNNILLTFGIMGRVFDRDGLPVTH